MSPADGAAARVGVDTEPAGSVDRQRDREPGPRPRRPPVQLDREPGRPDRDSGRWAAPGGGAHQFDPAAPVERRGIGAGDEWAAAGAPARVRREPVSRTVPAGRGDQVDRGGRAVPVVRSGIRLNGPWCAVLLVLGVCAVLLISGSFGWRPGVAVTISLAAVGVVVALLAGRGGAFEAGVLPGTVVIVVGALVVAADPGALGGAVSGLGSFSRVWQVIGLLAPAAAATWVCALVTLALRRAGLVRPF